MRTMIVVFIALLAIPFLQVAIDLRFDRHGAPVFINQSSRISTSFGKHLRTQVISDRPTVRATTEGKWTLVEVWSREFRGAQLPDPELGQSGLAH